MATVIKDVVTWLKQWFYTETEVNTLLNAKSNTNHNHDEISGGMLGVVLVSDNTGSYASAFNDKIIYDATDSEKIFYDHDGNGGVSANEIATIGTITDAVGDAITYINQ